MARDGRNRRKSPEMLKDQKRVQKVGSICRRGHRRDVALCAQPQRTSFLRRRKLARLRPASPASPANLPTIPTPLLPTVPARRAINRHRPDSPPHGTIKPMEQACSRQSSLSLLPVD
uniref:Uncharacterized protein n=1 Tax=Panagrellus redivivus TaxID=6233 RepID=A0A7E4UWL1_PANRE